MRNVKEVVAVILILAVLTVGLVSGTVWALIESGMLP